MMDLSISEIRDWLVILQTIATGMVLVAVLWLRARFVPRSEFEEHAKQVAEQFKSKRDRLDRGEMRFQELSLQLAALPNREQIHGLQLQMTGLSGDLRVLGERLDGQRTVVERMDKVLSRHEAIFANDRGEP